MSAKMEWGLALILFAAVAAPAAAQTPPPGASIDSRFRQQTAPRTEQERTEAMLTGDTDLVLLRRTPLFTATATLSVLPTSNAFLSPIDPHSDILFMAQGGLRIGTRIGGRVDLFAEAGVLAVRNARFESLGYSAFTGAAGASANLGGFDLALVYQPSIIYARDFRHRQLTQHQLIASLSHSFRAGPIVISPSVSGQRVESSPAEYRNWAASAEVTLSHQFRIGHVPSALFAGGGYERRYYDDYFSGLLGVDRKDRLLHASVGLAAQLTNWGSVRAAYTFQHNRSTSDVNGYTAHSGALSLTAALRF